MSDIQPFLVLAGLAEAVTQVIIQIIEGIQKKVADWWKMPLACLIAGILLYAAGLNLFLLVGVPLRIGGEFSLIFAAILGGVLVGRWGGAVNDILDVVRGFSDKTKAEAQTAEAEAEKA